MQQDPREGFGRNAEKYVTSEGHAKGADLDMLVQWLQPSPRWRVLDVATGGGHVARTLAPLVERVTALDLTPEMLDVARLHLAEQGIRNVDFLLADAQEIPLPDAAFDAIVCRIAPHHFPHPERFIAEAARLLWPGGLLLVIDNAAPDDPELGEMMNAFEALRDPGHARALSAEQWRALIADTGLTLLRDIRAPKIYEFRTWVRRMARDEAQVADVESYVLAMPPEAREYFRVETADGHVTKLTTAMWAGLAQKPL
jgi:ubiquinone/menaquinone biosynthesis C-methylase UbiE